MDLVEPLQRLEHHDVVRLLRQDLLIGLDGPVGQLELVIIGLRDPEQEAGTRGGIASQRHRGAERLDQLGPNGELLEQVRQPEVELQVIWVFGNQVGQVLHRLEGAIQAVLVQVRQLD